MKKTKAGDNNDSLLSDIIFIQKFIDSLSGWTMVLNNEEKIVFVSTQWEEFCLGNITVPDTGWMGVDYYLVCQQTMGLPGDEFEIIKKGIKSIISGLIDEFNHEYSLCLGAENQWFMINAKSFSHSEKKWVVISHKEITKRKQTETELLISKERYRGFSEATFEAIFFSEKGVCMEQNKVAETLFGYSSQEVVGKNLINWFVQEERDLVMKNILSGNEDSYQAIALRKNGSTFVAEIRGRMMHYRGKNIRITAVRDITKQKQAENALRESEEKHRILYINNPLPYQSINENGTIKEVNPAWLQALGYKQEEAVGSYFGDFLHPDWKSHFEKTFPAFKKHGYVRDVHFKIRHKEGYYIDIQLEGIIGLTSVGTFKQTYCVFQDVTALIQSKKELEESEEKYRVLFTSANDAIFLMRNDKFIACNPKTLEMFACEEDEIVGHSPVLFSPIHQPDGSLSTVKVDKKINAALSGEPQFFEWVHKRKDDVKFYAEVSLNKMVLSDGEYIHAIVRNINQRKVSERALKENEARLSTLLSNLPGMAYLCIDDECWTMLYLNGACEELTGYKPEQLINNKEITYNQLIHPDDRKYVDEQVAKSLSRKEHFELEYRIITATGDEKWVWERGVQSISEHDQINLIEGVIDDITERKQTEKALQESELKVRSILSAMDDSVFVLDNENRFISVYASNQKLFENGKTFVGKTHEEVMPDYINEQFEVALKDVKQGKTMGYEYDTYTPEGSLSWYALKLSPMIIDNKYIGLVGVARNISKRKLAEEFLKSSEKRLRDLSSYMDSKHEREKKEIAKGIHDGLGQLFTGIKMDLQWIEKKWPGESKLLKNKFISMNNTIDIGVKEVQKLSVQLRPKMLDDLGLLEALKSETAHFEERTGIKCNLLFVPYEFEVEYHKSSTIYRIMMELLTNIFRHANASRVDIKLEMKENFYTFTVIDDGVGITQDQIEDSSSFGILSIAERIKALNGGLNIIGKHNIGTTVNVTIPL